jgi:hypothetical protein
VPHGRGTVARPQCRNETSLCIEREGSANTVRGFAKVTDFRERFLRPEFSGILNWALEGLARWRREGLRRPASVRAATDEYRSAMDSVEQWIEERAELDPAATQSVQDLHNDYVNYLGPHGHPFGRRRFSKELERKGYAACKKDGARARRGLKLKPPDSFGSIGSTAHCKSCGETRPAARPPWTHRHNLTCFQVFSYDRENIRKIAKTALVASVRPRHRTPVVE